jgi:hypothetical protein
MATFLFGGGEGVLAQAPITTFIGSFCRYFDRAKCFASKSVARSHTAAVSLLLRANMEQPISWRCQK